MNSHDWSFSVQRLIIPKDGNTQSECEDAIGMSVPKLRFCVADGATEGFDSRRWARLLVKHWTASTRPLVTSQEFDAWVPAIGERFETRWHLRQLSWYAEEKAQAGAFAAFVGLAFHEIQQDLFWNVIALGDACLFVRREDRLVHSCPIDDPTEFGNSPILLASKPSAQISTLGKLFTKSDKAQIGDRFILLTDAIAAWYLRSFLNDRSQALLFEELLADERKEEIAELLASNKDTGALRNDDVAALHVSIQQSSE